MLSTFQVAEGPAAFTGWVKSFVHQFIRKRTLEFLCRNVVVGHAPVRNPRLKITALGVDQTRYRLPCWATFEGVIERSIKSAKDNHGLSPVEAIDALKIKIEDCSTHPDKKLRSREKYFNVVDKFCSLLKGETQTVYLGLHAEAVLSVLMKCPPSQILNSDCSALKALCEVHSLSPCYIHD